MSHWVVKVGLDQVDPEFAKRIREQNPTAIKEVIEIGPKVFVVEPHASVRAEDLASRLTGAPGIAFAHPVRRSDAETG